MLSAGDAAGRRLRSNGVAGSNQIAIGRRNLPGSHSDPNVRKPIYRDANRLVDQASFKGREPAAGRSSRVRKQVQAYTDTGSSTRKPCAKLDADDCMDAIAGIMPSMSRTLQQPDKKSNEEKHPEITRRKKMRTSSSKMADKQLMLGLLVNEMSATSDLDYVRQNYTHTYVLSNDVLGLLV